MIVVVTCSDLYLRSVHQTSSVASTLLPSWAEKYQLEADLVQGLHSCDSQTSCLSCHLLPICRLCLTVRICCCRYNRLGWLMNSGIIAFNSSMVWVLARLHLAPAGMEDVHTMLVSPH